MWVSVHPCVWLCKTVVCYRECVCVWVLIAAEASIFHVDRWERKERPSLSGCMSVRCVSPLFSRKWATASLPVCCCCCFAAFSGETSCFILSWLLWWVAQVLLSKGNSKAKKCSGSAIARRGRDFSKAVDKKQLNRMLDSWQSQEVLTLQEASWSWCTLFKEFKTCLS